MGLLRSNVVSLHLLEEAWVARQIGAFARETFHRSYKSSTELQVYWACTGRMVHHRQYALFVPARSAGVGEGFVGKGTEPLLKGASEGAPKEQGGRSKVDIKGAQHAGSLEWRSGGVKSFPSPST